VRFWVVAEVRLDGTRLKKLERGRGKLKGKTQKQPPLQRFARGPWEPPLVLWPKQPQTTPRSTPTPQAPYYRLPAAVGAAPGVVEP